MEAKETIKKDTQKGVGQLRLFRGSLGEEVKSQPRHEGEKKWAKGRMRVWGNSILSRRKSTGEGLEAEKDCLPRIERSFKDGVWTLGICSGARGQDAVSKGMESESGHSVGRRQGQAIQHLSRLSSPSGSSYIKFVSTPIKCVQWVIHSFLNIISYFIPPESMATSHFSLLIFVLQHCQRFICIVFPQISSWTKHSVFLLLVSQCID